jgi:uncharacterized membrane protein
VTPAIGILLLINAIFNIVTWPAFYRRVARDPRARDAAGKATRFLTVHVVLVGIALVLAAASALAGILVLIGIW